ncbi:hypothetical protein DFJ73DRAFT_197938 [Zopfochytrium polystomum]|nr:hypothetical protein DFJ73DRAFT_197938 [Zopfochytrium polystomum]
MSEEATEVGQNVRTATRRNDHFYGNAGSRSGADWSEPRFDNSANYHIEGFSRYSLVAHTEAPKVEEVETLSASVVSDGYSVDLSHDTHSSHSPRSGTPSPEWDSTPVRLVDSYEKTTTNLPATANQSAWEAGPAQAEWSRTSYFFLQEQAASAEITATEAARPPPNTVKRRWNHRRRRSTDCRS